MLSKALAGQQKTTAEDIADRLGIDVPEGVRIGQFPPWMLEAASLTLRETFAQDYWLDIDVTTRNNIETTLRDGIEQGLSMRNIAKSIVQAHGSEYSMSRALNVARTETGNTLNGGAASAIEQTASELGMQIGKEWISLLGPTTRRTHADADGQTTTTAGGLFNLAGFLVPWPSHHSLPVGERANCQCGLISAPVMEFMVA